MCGWMWEVDVRVGGGGGGSGHLGTCRNFIFFGIWYLTAFYPGLLDRSYSKE